MIKTRGEMSIQIDGKDYTMVPSFQAIDGIDSCGKGIIELAMRASDGTLLSSEIVNVIHQGILASGEKIDRDTIGKAMMDAGVANYYSIALDFLKVAMQGTTPPKNEEAESQ